MDRHWIHHLDSRENTCATPTENRVQFQPFWIYRITQCSVKSRLVRFGTDRKFGPKSRILGLSPDWEQLYEFFHERCKSWHMRGIPACAMSFGLALWKLAQEIVPYLVNVPQSEESRARAWYRVTAALDGGDRAGQEAGNGWADTAGADCGWIWS